MRISSRIALFKNVSIVIGVIFILAGSALLGVSYAMYMDGLYFRRNGVRTEAVIEKIRHDDIWIRYSTGKNTFTSLLGYYDSSLREGDTILIYYDYNKPGRSYTVSSALLCRVVTTSGLLMVFGGAMVGFFISAGKRRERWLLRNGIQIQAKIIGVNMDQNISGNYQHPYRVVCQSLMPDGSIREFLSWHLWYDPTGSFLSDSVTVFLDPNDDSQYYMDLFSVLPDGEDEASGIGEDL